ncbi:murein biosynthesis integral membrane protein MurJ [Campylobacter vicugnae]|uniref:murein biosynthesis integral membrane protein MurJ n=1 Tax=Campylobacter vicugnae TaxID=1660076 RepID=UPI0025509E23|nr:murein biosynthesis integral membrane protein MurJ [Campylobacter ovis]MDL0105003.1 murein biosynthesis integral membrane protein MurJ [Campylobacter ovis]MDL0107169.1 murein biosynthesis integral membrane protein MurJ [Campylobacter ovis]
MLKHFFTNSIGILCSRVLGFIRDLMTANALGASIWSDIFFVAFKLPNLFRRLFGEGAFSQAFMPNLIKVSQKGLFAAEILIKLSLTMLILSLIVMLFAPLVTKILAYGFNADTIALAVPLVRINFWYLLAIFIVTLLSSMLQYKNHFATTAFSTALLNISMIIALLLAVNLDQKTAALYLSWGVVIGGLLQVLSHIIALKKVNLLRLLTLGIAKFAKGKRAKAKGFWQNFGHGIMGSSANQLSDFISTFIASFLATGAISYLYYANRIFQLPLALFAIAISTAIFPKIAKAIKSNNNQIALNLFKKSFSLLFFLLLFSTIGGYILAKEIIWLLFQRGEFNTQNTIESAKVLQMYMLGLLPFGLYKLFSLWLYAKMQQKIAAKIAIYSLFINTALCIILFKPLGASGLALAGSISGVFLLVYVIFVFGIRQFLGIILEKINLITIILSAVFAYLLIELKDFVYANL